jgi:uncharacterized protein (DUF2267 family)
VRNGEFIEAVARRLAVSPEQATKIARSTLDTLTERIDGAAAKELAAQLPRGFQEYLRQPHETAEPFGMTEFVRRVSARADVDDAVAIDGARAVLDTVREAAAPGKLDEVVAQLPKEFRQLTEPIRPDRDQPGEWKRG